MAADRLAAGLILRHADVPARWLLLHTVSHGEWSFPKGHLDPGESFLAAALRECAEETGIALVAVTGPARELTYRLPDGRTKLVRYYPAVTHQETVSLSDEHDDWDWLPHDLVCDRMVHTGMRLLFDAVARRG